MSHISGAQKPHVLMATVLDKKYIVHFHYHRKLFDSTARIPPSLGIASCVAVV